ncbi:unnamed protein product [Caenorhabditis auriculariae]|uniref:Uncharacterized protein n=1 Tax=Caenorhabditis auriculariae TaxID=2777116 RepID=A0A8S1HTS6_9PELO|nr:unnamed protein product [Caenorhabditis auriculariae]
MGDAVGDKLKVLEIDSCPRITEFGLAHVVKFPALKELKLQNLKSVHGKEKVHEKLKRALPNTNINFNV